MTTQVEKLAAKLDLSEHPRFRERGLAMFIALDKVWKATPSQSDKVAYAQVLIDYGCGD